MLRDLWTYWPSEHEPPNAAKFGQNPMTPAPLPDPPLLAALVALVEVRGPRVNEWAPALDDTANAEFVVATTPTTAIPARTVYNPIVILFMCIL
jgi:hypothetical protein